ncbi:MAG: MBL fold metallo-hydrolase, partial [Candidatus Obscuribacterales bacterium]|nr:MBL fold metallo-hydrolase [Steroidobacteraceae bacterium]
GFVDTDLLSRFFSGKMFRSGLSGIPEIAYRPTDGEQIRVGDIDWQVYETNGHAEGHQCLSAASSRILISGDQVLPTISSNVSFSPRGGDRNPLASYLGSLERLSQLDKQTLVLPSHGRPFFGLQIRAADLIAHHHVHLDAVVTACEQPKNAYELVPVLFKRRLVGSHWMFAMGETIAHVEYLVAKNRLTRGAGSDGTTRYSRC